MPSKRVNYDQLAPTYNLRFTADSDLNETALALRRLAAGLDAKRILEVGCGTARWLASLVAPGRQLYGLDYSNGMLAQARHQQAPLHLVRSSAEQMPAAADSIDLIYCVNAIHHFQHQEDFVVQARRALRPCGVLAIVGMDPHTQTNEWYVYDYFPGTRRVDLERFPSWGQVLHWLISADFGRITWQPVLEIQDTKIGEAVLDDPFLSKQAVSQLALLSDDEYAAGLQRIEAAITQAEEAGQTITFQSDIRIAMITGWAENKGRVTARQRGSKTGPA